jgi:hypothetical protein
MPGCLWRIIFTFCVRPETVPFLGVFGKKEPEAFGPVDGYSCFGAASVQETQYIPGRASFGQPQTGGS